MRLAQEERSSRNERPQTTHFGFETIAEGLKQGKGMLPNSRSKSTVNLVSSRPGLLLGRLLVRYNE